MMLYSHTMASSAIQFTGPFTGSANFTTTLPASVPLATISLPIIDLSDWTTNLAVAVSILSSLGSFIILACYMMYTDMRTTSREILAYLSVCDILSNAMIIWGVAWSSRSHSNVSSDNVQCQVQAVILIYAGIAEYLWTCALAFYLFVIIVRQSLWGSKMCPRIIHLACWGTGFIIAPLAFGLKKTGVDVQARNTAQWCILRDAEDPKMGGDRNYVIWSFLVGDGWGFLAIVCTLVFYILIKRHIYLQKHNKLQDSAMVTQGSMSAAAVVDRKLTWIPIIYFLLHIWSPIRTIISLSSSNENHHLTTTGKVLIALQTFGDCSEGLTNSIIFVLFSPKLRQRLKENICTCMYRVCLRCMSKTRTYRPRRVEGEQARLLRGAIASTYAQSTTITGPVPGFSSNAPVNDSMGSHSGDTNLAPSDATLSTNTTRRSYAI